MSRVHGEVSKLQEGSRNVYIVPASKHGISKSGRCGRAVQSGKAHTMIEPKYVINNVNMLYEAEQHYLYHIKQYSQKLEVNLHVIYIMDKRTTLVQLVDSPTPVYLLALLCFTA